MSIYRNLSVHLAGLKRDPWVAKFQEIEAVLGFPLPRSAYAYPAWWSNQTGGGHTQSTSWQSVGWRTGELDLANQKVSFFLAESDRKEQREASRNSAIGPKDGLSIADAKAGVATYYGVAPENVEITIRG